MTVTLDPQLLEILVCPNDRGDLDYRESEQLLVCTKCGYRYPIRDDIPVMLIDEAQRPDQNPDQKPGQKPGKKPGAR
ncbi:MAG: Trm112 family protein [Actinomycetota bacterium]